jgi:hypothetical protein
MFHNSFIDNLWEVSLSFNIFIKCYVIIKWSIVNGELLGPGAVDGGKTKVGPDIIISCFACFTDDRMIDWGVGARGEFIFTCKICAFEKRLKWNVLWISMQIGIPYRYYMIVMKFLRVSWLIIVIFMYQSMILI